jgi:hypothetical protein
VDEAHFCGLSAGFKSDYVRHYAALDQYAPLLDGSWKKLSECLPDRVLRRSEWYNDFILTCGVRDICGDTACRYVRSLRYLRYSPADRPQLLRQRRSPRSAIFDLSQTEVSAEGSRFYFHVDDGSRYPDETGSVFSTADDAMAYAIVVAQELAQRWQLARIIHSRYGRPGTRDCPCTNRPVGSLEHSFATK